MSQERVSCPHRALRTASLNRVSRIIAGRARGHTLSTPRHNRTRPTTDRVRESAFGLIADWAGTAGESGDQMLERFSFLDLYSGSGAVALEAASRGAAPVVAVEKDRSTAALIRANAEATHLTIQVQAASVETYLEGTASPFDIVWLDPPYDVPGPTVAHVVATVTERWLAEDGLIIVERSARDGSFDWPETFVEPRERRYGETTLHLASRETP